MRIWFFIRIALLLLPLVSCVGEVEVGEVKKADYLDPAVDTFEYVGIVDARAIAHDKIEIDFLPAGTSERFTHELYINDAQTPVELQLETIAKIDGGVYRYILKERSLNTAYKLRVRARDKLTGAVSEGENIELISTFDNITADFQGVARVDPVPGATATSVIVDWNPATFVGGIGPTSYDPYYYIVTYITDTGGPQNLNNPAYTGMDRQERRVPNLGFISPSNHPTELKIESLQPGTKYYFQVRAVHKNWHEFSEADPNKIPIKREQNTVYISHMTTGTGGVVDFNRRSLKVSKAPGQQAFRSLRVSWDYGEGAYTRYRLFMKPFQGADILNGDEMRKLDLSYETGTNVSLPCAEVGEGSGLVAQNYPSGLAADPVKIACFDIPTIVNNIQINNLEKHTNYQVKVALCLDSECDLQDGAPNQGILSESVIERTAPVLAPFDGITGIRHPQEEPDVITLDFNAIGVSQGYANQIRVYCLDPAGTFPPTLLPANGSAASAPGSVCDGLKAQTAAGNDLSTVNAYSSLGDVSSLRVKGVDNTLTSPEVNYCFAVTPAIAGDDADGVDVEIPQTEWVARCIQPELKVPTVEEFPGLVGSCSVFEDSATLSWDAPTGGMYDSYTVFYKEDDSSSFSFNQATSGAGGYTALNGITNNTQKVEGLTPGKTYVFGVLSALASGSGTVYSEPNLQTLKCHIPLPTGRFIEWTRVLALGPKVDGRIPLKDYANDNPWPGIRSPDFAVADPESRIYEAISTEGIPYEVTDQMDPAGYGSPPPGQDSGNFSPGSSTTFDGALSGGDSGYAASNRGIISLAWKDMELSFLQNSFESLQDSQSPDRSARSYGYRVYRSDNYGSSWTDVTYGNLITAVNYSYRVRANEDPVPKRMAFFTDYSVQHLFDIAELARARVYLYKVVPVFAGKELESSFKDSSNVIRVTLPPPNMALVHRKMANRSACMELGKNFESSNNYVCSYNGLGARARGVPWKVDETVIDQGGDLLVDRFELGCNYTRGDLTGGGGTEYMDGASFFDTDGVAGDGVEGAVFSDNAVFKGENNSGSSFRGCRAPSWGAPGQSFVSPNNGNYVQEVDNPYGGSNPDYNGILFGDCIGDNADSIPEVFDTNPLDEFHPDTARIMLPGARRTSVEYDPGIDEPGSPQFALDRLDEDGEIQYSGKYGRNYIQHTVSQGEFAAVYYNRNNNVGRRVSPLGPGDEQLFHNNNNSFKQKCFINLAAIGSEAEGGYWRSRWIPTSAFDNVHMERGPDAEPVKTGGIELLTINEILNAPTLYEAEDESNHYRPIPETRWDPDRIKGDMPLGRVISSNSAKLPPIAGASLSTLQNICSTYKVQVGIADSAGFQPLMPPKSKRLIRRGESVTAGKFPDSFSNALNLRIERGNDTSSYAINGRDRINACNGEEKSLVGVSALRVGDLLNPSYASSSSSGLMPTGTGVLDGDRHAESCVSRFGVHDIPGNALETNSDELFCDYNEESMVIYFGEKDSVANSVPYPWADDRSGDYYVAQDAYLCFENYGVGGPDAPDEKPSSCPTCSWEDPDGDDIYSWCRMSGNSLWRYVDSYAGYCSIVDSTSSKVNDVSNFRKNSQAFESIFNPDGSLNSRPVSRAKRADQESVNALRNGDGYFANFGESNLGPSFKAGASFAFDGMAAKYFNPVVGLPLACSSYRSRESCGVESSDNKNVTLETLWKAHNIDGDDPGMPISKFPVGNAKGNNRGVSDIVGAEDPVLLEDGFRASSRRIVRGMTKPASGSALRTVVTPQESSLQVYRMRWELPRNSILAFFTGGDYSANSGVYSIEAFDQGRSRYNNSGGRCAVLINEGN